MADNTTRQPCAIIFTANPIGSQAVRSHLLNPHEGTLSDGSIYECGTFKAEKRTWDVVIVEVCTGDAGSAPAARQAISNYRPELMFFVGVSGGLKDVAIGDVVVATKVYGFEFIDADRTFQSRSELDFKSYSLEKRAWVERVKSDWLKRLENPVPNPAPRVFIAPIAAGENVVSSNSSAIFKFLTETHGDALAVEMESHGSLRVARANQQFLTLIIRGISDLIDKQADADAKNIQELATRHASAFAFEVLAKYDHNKTFEEFTRSQRGIKDFKDKVDGIWKEEKDGNGDNISQHKQFKDSAKYISKTLKDERQIITFFPENKSWVETIKLAKTEEAFTDWYYKRLDDYEQYYVLTTAILHGSPVGEVVKHTDSLYRFIHDEVERRGNVLRVRYREGVHWESQQIGSARFSDPLLRTTSGQELRGKTYTKTRKERGVERLYWQDADEYGLSTFGLQLLEFLSDEYIGKGELGQFFLNALQRWSEESVDEVARKATYSYGVVLGCHDIKTLKRLAKKWAKEDNPRRTAELLDGAYEIEHDKSVEKAPSVVLALLKKWVKHIHKVLDTDGNKFEFDILESENQTDTEDIEKKEGENQTDTEDIEKKEGENQADEDEFSKEEFDPKVAIMLGCAVASTYALIGKRSPDIALEGLEDLLKLPLSNSTIDLDDISKIFAAGVSANVILTWSGRVRNVIEHLATSAEQLSHARNLPRISKKRHKYRRQRAVYLEVTLEAFFLVAAASSTDVQKIQDIQYCFRKKLYPQPAIPDTEGRDALLAFLLNINEAGCQKYITTLLCAAIVERKTFEAFGLLRYWAEIVLRIRESQASDAEEMYVIFLQFFVNLGSTVKNWCFDLGQQNLLTPPAFETFKNRLSQWCTEGNYYSHPIGSFAKEVLEQLVD